MSFPLMPQPSPANDPGVSWEPVGALSSNLQQLSVSPDGVWVAADGSTVGTIRRSTDYGATWSAVSTGSSDVNGSEGSAYGNGLFVITDLAGNGIYSSSDGSSWTLRETNSRDNHRASFSDGYFVVGSGTNGGNGAIYASANGTSWTYNAQGAVGANSATCGIYVSALNRTFAGGSQYKYVNAAPTSATAWTGTPTGLSGRITDVAWGNSIGVVTGPSGIYSSADLITWTLRASLTNMYGVSWCETQFVAVGSSGQIYTSPDGVSWTARTSGTANALYGAASCNGVILVVGSGGTVLRSS
jgi:hypothetical protein